MNKIITTLVALVVCLVSTAKVKPADESQITRVEPPCWWIGMNTSLQIMVQGPNISECEVELEGKGLKIDKVHKADNPNFIFIDVAVDKSAKAGVYDLIFTRGKKKFYYAYEFGTKRTERRISG